MPPKRPGLDAEQRIVEQRVGVPDELVPVLDQVGAAGVQEADLGVGVDRRQPGQRPVQLRHMAAVQPVRGVREQQIARALQHRLHPPAQPVPGVEGAAMPGALLAEAVAVAVHPQQRGRGVDAQGVQSEPAVGHAGVDPYRGAELLLGLRVGAHRVGVHAAQPGEVGRGLRALRAEVHHVPHEPCPRRCAAGPSPVGRLGQPLTEDRSCRCARQPPVGRTEGIVPAAPGPPKSAAEPSFREEGVAGRRRRMVTEGERSGVRSPESGLRAERSPRSRGNNRGLRVCRRLRKAAH